MSTTDIWIEWAGRTLAAMPREDGRGRGGGGSGGGSSGGGAGAALRGAALAAAVALGAAACTTAQAGDDGPRLVNSNGSQEVVHARPPRGNVVGGAYATVTGGGDNMTYSAAPGGRVAEPRLVARLEGGGDEARLIYEAPAAAGTMTAAGPGAPSGG